jgi:hypothetical protein
VTAPTSVSLASWLPPELRFAWERVEADASGLLGQTRSINSLVARHRSTFEALIDGGLRYQDLVTLMNEARIRRADGGTVKENAIAAAISRARRAVSAEPHRSREGLTRPKIDLRPHVGAHPAPAAEPPNLKAAGPDPPASAVRNPWQEPSGVIHRSHLSANLKVARLLNSIGEQDD